jgi:histidinol-phosphate phosphatase family protein
VSKPAAFLDRDGVLNHRIVDGYVTCPEELQVLPHAAEAIRVLRERGYAIVVVTNQRGIARGLMTDADLERVHTALRERLAAQGAELDAIYRCPHGDQDGCTCRKPAPGMLLAAAEELDLDLSRSVLVGDSETDIAAGQAAGVPVTVLIESDGDVRAALDRIPEAGA